MTTQQEQSATSPTAAPVNPPSADNPTPATAAPGSISISQIDTDRLDLKALDEIMGSGADPGKAIALPIKAVEGVSQEGAPPATVPATIPAQADSANLRTSEPVPPTAPVIPAPEDDQLPSRFRFNDERDQKIASLRKGGMDWKEAIEFVDGKAPAAEFTMPPENPVDMLQATDARIAELEEVVSGAGNDEALFGAELAAATIELNRLSRQRPSLEAEVNEHARRQQQQEQDRVTTEKQSKENAKAMAIARFPDVASHETPLGKAVAQRIAEMKDENHPDHAILFAATAPLIVTRMIASEMGISEVNLPASLPGSQIPQPAPVLKVASPVSGSARTVQPLNTQPKVTVDTLRASDSLEDLDAAFGASGQPLLQAIR